MLLMANHGFDHVDDEGKATATTGRKVHHPVVTINLLQCWILLHLGGRNSFTVGTANVAPTRVTASVP